MLSHKRGVENVINFQSNASRFDLNYYLHWNEKTYVFRYQNIICIGIKKNILWFLTLNIVLYKIKRRDSCLFIHSHNALMSIISYYQTNILTVHDGLFYLAKSTKHKLSILFWLLEKVLYVRCKYVHFISFFAKDMSLFNSDVNFSIIPNTSHFESGVSKPPLLDLRTKKFSLESKKVFIVRSIEERAFVDLVIDVAAILENENFEFIIAGKGTLLMKYRTVVSDLGLKNIALLGYVSDHDVINYYMECDVVLMTALYGEGFGLPIIEGYLYNKPVVASKVCAIPEIIISESFLFDNTAQSLIDRLYFALDQRSIDFRGYYDDYFSNERIFLDMSSLYRIQF